MPSDEFKQHIADLYQYLYDLVYLRTHPLTDTFIPDETLSRKDKAWQLHELLLDVIEELDPGPQAPAFSREWRRHRLMVQRYKNGLEPMEICQEIAVSRRQFYREHRAALEAIADLLWGRFMTQEVEAEEAPETEPPDEPAGEAEPSHLELLRLEVARAARAERFTRAEEVIEGVMALLEERLRQQALLVQRVGEGALPNVAVEKGLLRQLLLGIFGYLVERARDARLQWAGQHEEDVVHLSLRVEPPEAVSPPPERESAASLAALEELATLSRAHLTPAHAGQKLVGFDVRLPTDAQWTVLVVDDNADILDLFRRFLVPHRYRVLTAQSAAEGLELATRLHPDIITLDLMLPGQDGWDFLQTLLNQPEIRHIPVIVCSVLKQKDLALSLGAAAFLEKPVGEQELLATLKLLKEEQPLA